MTKTETLKQARIKRDTERLELTAKCLPLDQYQAERTRINNEWLAVKEANKPTRTRPPEWLKADRARFNEWLARQV